MSNVEEFPFSARQRPTQFEALVAAGHAALDAIPGAVYLSIFVTRTDCSSPTTPRPWNLGGEHLTLPRRSA
ncbi:hypothetical protein, partial [Bradyrhizobium sp. 18]|uniref:hypothetical protein n=1 Tax=Bradyrhizobium sp. 18 TaxID=2782657 RepID=UPI001FF82273